MRPIYFVVSLVVIVGVCVALFNLQAPRFRRSTFTTFPLGPDQPAPSQQPIGLPLMVPEQAPVGNSFDPSHRVAVASAHSLAHPLPETLTIATTEEDGINAVAGRRYDLTQKGQLEPESRFLLHAQGSITDMQSLHFAPDGQTVYVLGSAQQPTILQMRVDPNGTVSPLSPPSVTAGAPYQPLADDSLVSSPNSKNLYALCSDGIHQYSADKAGRLKPLEVPVIKTAPVVLSPEWKSPVTTHNGVNSYQFRRGNFLTTSALAFAPNGKTAYAYSEINYFSGTQTVDRGATVAFMSVAAQGTRVTVSRFLTSLRVGKYGTLKPIGARVTLPRSVTSLRVGPAGRFLCTVGANIQIYRLNADGSIASKPWAQLPGTYCCFSKDGDGLFVAQSSPWPGHSPRVEDFITSYRLALDAKPTKSAKSAIIRDIYGPPSDLCVDRTGKFLCSVEGDTVAVYAAGPSGQLSQQPLDQVACMDFPSTISFVAGTAAHQAIAAPARVVKGPSIPEAVYVLNQQDGTIGQYAIGKGGELAPLSPSTVAAGLGQWPTSMAADKTAGYLYVSGDPFAPIQAYHIGSSGSLTQAPSSTGLANKNQTLGEIVVDPSGPFLYAPTESPAFLNIYRTGTNGALSLTGNMPIQPIPWPGVIDVNRKKNMVGILQGNGYFITYRFNTNGSLKQLAQTQLPVNGPVAFSPSGNNAYYLNGGEVYELNVGNDGTLTSHDPSTVPTDESPMQIAFTPDGHYAYVANKGDFYGDGGVSEYRADASGTLNPLKTSEIMTGTSPMALAVDPSGHFLYTLSQGRDKNMNFPDPGTISQFSINRDGTLSPLKQCQIPTGRYPVSLLIVQPRKT